jgi:hypothetical protein
LNNSNYSATLDKGAISPVVVCHCNGRCRLATSDAVTVRVGSATQLASAPAGATDVYYPAGVHYILYDTGTINNAMSIYAFNAGTIVTMSGSVVG